MTEFDPRNQRKEEMSDCPESKPSTEEKRTEHPQPLKPVTLHPLAEELLTAISANPSSQELVLGGHFALKHYADYRQTQDVDAWWKTAKDSRTLELIRTVIGEMASQHGMTVKERSFGDTTSFDFLEAGKKVFALQIAERTIELEPPVVSPWPPILIETLRDNIGSKMNALVGRGAPRDFVDIKVVTERGLLTVRECWELWQQKNPTETITSGRQKALLMLKALELRRPLSSIGDEAERQKADTTREWFKTIFLAE